MPPDAQEVKVMRALVKETLGRAQVDRLADDIAEACKTLEEKGGAHPHERKKMKRSPGY
jgi:glutamate decarboxylase